MKKMMCVVAAGVLILTACNNKQPEAAATETTTRTVENTAGVNIPLASLADNIDHVCKMPLTEGGIADTAQYDGKVYGFCATGCKEDFLKDPAYHLANKQ